LKKFLDSFAANLHTLAAMEIKNMHNFNKYVENSMDEIIRTSGIYHKASAHDLDSLKREIRKELRKNWCPKHWATKEIS
jgi:endonuclease III-like uncharacterized protein